MQGGNLRFDERFRPVAASVGSGSRQSLVARPGGYQYGTDGIRPESRGADRENDAQRKVRCAVPKPVLVRCRRPPHDRPYGLPRGADRLELQWAGSIVNRNRRDDSPGSGSVGCLVAAGMDSPRSLCASIRCQAASCVAAGFEGLSALPQDRQCRYPRVSVSGDAGARKPDKHGCARPKCAGFAAGQVLLAGCRDDVREHLGERGEPADILGLPFGTMRGSLLRGGAERGLPRRHATLSELPDGSSPSAPVCLADLISRAQRTLLHADGLTLSATLCLGRS